MTDHAGRSPVCEQSKKGNVNMPQTTDYTEVLNKNRQQSQNTSPSGGSQPQQGGNISASVTRLRDDMANALGHISSAAARVMDEREAQQIVSQAFRTTSSEERWA